LNTGVRINSDMSDVNQEPLVAFFRKYNQKLLLLATTLVLGLVAFSFIKNRMLDRERSSSESFSSMHTAFINWRKGLAAEKKDEKGTKLRVDESKTSLDSLQTALISGGGSYAEYATFYKMLTSIVAGDKDVLGSVESLLLKQQLGGKTIEGISKNFLIDLKAFVIARTYLAAESDTEQQKGKTLLIKLIDNDSFAATAAVKSLYLAGKNSVEKSKYLLYFDKIKQSQPWQADIINQLKEDLLFK
jgi:hypothetical protein